MNAMMLSECNAKPVEFSFYHNKRTTPKHVKHAAGNDTFAGSFSSSLQLSASVPGVVALGFYLTVCSCSAMFDKCRDKVMLLWCGLICIFTHLFAVLYIVCVYLYSAHSGGAAHAAGARYLCIHRDVLMDPTM